MPVHRARLVPLIGALLALGLPLGAAGAVDVQRLGDINEVGANSFPGQFVTLGSDRLFTASTPETGRELFVSRGGADDTQLLVDITPGPDDTVISGLQRATLQGDDVAVFFTGGFRTGGGLWRTDGTSAGTFPIVENVAVRNIAAAPALGLVVFAGEDDVAGLEPWVTDGTPGGTVRLADINPGIASSTGKNYFAFRFTVSGSRIYFPADDGVAGTELWTSDGTPGGTQQVDELVDDSFESRSFRHFAADGAGGVYFTIDGNSNDRAELWFSADGTAGNTAQVPFDNAYDTNTTVRNIRVLPSGAVYFINGFDELQRTDGTNTDPVVIGGGGSTPFEPSAQDLSRVVVEFDPPARTEAVYALGRGDGSEDHELWRIEGATATEQISDTGADDPERARSTALTVAGSRLFFAADDGTTGLELWRSDGTPGGTALVTEIAAGIASGFAPGNRPAIAATSTGVIFAGFDEAGGREPWFSSGTAAGTERIADLRPGTGDTEIFANFFVPLGGEVVFRATDGVSGRELWRTDGDGVTRIKDINTGPEDSFPSWPAVLGDTLYFSAEAEASGRELWSTDGTAAGTVLVGEIRPGTDGGSPAELTAVDGRLLFRACCDSQFRPELWVSDGTAAGTEVLLDIHPTDGSFPRLFARVGTRVYFGADDGSSGEEPWRSDGTAGGTLRLGDLEPGAGDSRPGGFVAVGDRVYFEASDAAAGREPHVYDPGTDTVTRLANIDGDITDSVSSGLNPLLPGAMLGTGDTVYFSAVDASSGREPWLTDGTPGGTRRLADIAAGADSSIPLGFTEYDGAVYFSATTPANGRELYRYDPGNDTVARITDVASGPDDGVAFQDSSGLALPLLVFDGRLFFTGIDANGTELWSTDGTTGGTRREADIVPGAGGSGTALLAVIAGALYFRADDGATGQELWRATPVSESGSGGGDSDGGSSGGGGGGGGGGTGLLALLLGLAGGARRFRRSRCRPGGSKGRRILWSASGTRASLAVRAIGGAGD
jgi:ELWxxDGT repeat protein